ncbi:1,6-dihydroxycyclohexa-2,4-diene-1-carboxylate dehydrogenase [Immundisolibacter sp.]|uniref:1,6-dihydroxycyclohexa-2,4-diene-1-carboxylate dehydrogenase n=2 Tax=Immundisolibacter sp. TaxID=1934948 RepID=UPI003568EAF2
MSNNPYHCHRFEGQVAVVTGSAQGIGRATARRLAAEGARVIVADRAEPQARTVRDEIRAAGGQAEVVLADLETWAGAQQLADGALAAYDRIDVLVNNVGGTIWARPYWEYAPEEIEKEVQRSLWPTLWTCRAVIPHMVERRAGAIVNVGSTATRGVYRVPYTASKGGVHAITVSLAYELAEFGVRVNCIAPGGTDVGQRAIPRAPAPPTERDQQWMQGVMDQTLQDTFIKRFATPDEQAAAICFLASPEASYLTGYVLPVSGGTPI